MRAASLKTVGLSVLLSTTILSYAYAEESKQMEKVVVTAEDSNDETIAEDSNITKSNLSVLDTSRSVSIITEQRMKDRGITTLQDAFQYSAGVYGGVYGDDTRVFSAKVRGRNPDIYTDGLKSTFGFYNSARPNYYSFDRVSILKGPASVEYGQGTVGGIINYDSKLPELGEDNEVTAKYGSFDHKEIGVDFNGQLDDEGQFLFRLVGNFQDSEHQTNHVQDDWLAFNPSLTWNISDQTSITLLGNIQENNSGTGTQFLPHAGTIFDAPNGDIPWDAFLSEPGFDRYDTSQRALSVFADHRFNDAWSVSAKARYSEGDSDYYTMYPAFPPTINPDGTTIDRVAYISEGEVEVFTTDIRGTGEFNTGSVKHNLNFGFDYQEGTTDSASYYGAGGSIDLYNPVYGNLPTGIAITNNPSSTTRQKGVYVNDTLTIMDNILLSLGLRWDDTTSKTQGGTAQDDTKFTKNAGLMYVFENGIRPYVSYAESFSPVIGADVFGNSYDPQEGVQYEAGVKYQIPGTESIFTAAVFDITEDNRLTADPNNPLNRIQDGEVNIQGLELEGQFKYGDFDFLASYTRLDTEVTKSNNGDEGYHLADIPDHMASAWVTYRPSDFWQGFKAGAGLRYVGESWDGSDTFQRDSFTLADAMIGYEFEEGWDVQLTGHNLTDKKYYGSCLSRGDCFLGERRTVYLSLTRRF